jgi:tRNA(Ile)-lysidine synthase TilS/MesJ
LIAYSGGKIPVHSPFFYILSKKMELNIGVVYCNHNWTILRLVFVSLIIQNLNLPFYFVDSNRAIKPENQARDWRYQSFATILNNSHYDLLLTGR